MIFHNTQGKCIRYYFLILPKCIKKVSTNISFDILFCRYHYRKSNGFVNPQPPSRIIEPLENLQGVMRVKPQKPITSSSREMNPSQREENDTTHKTAMKDNSSKLKLSTVPTSSTANATSFLPLLPKSPVSISFVSNSNSSTTNATSKDGSNSLTITPTVIYSNRTSQAVSNKRKRSIKSLDSNSEVSIN